MNNQVHAYSIDFSQTTIRSQKELLPLKRVGPQERCQEKSSSLLFCQEKSSPLLFCQKSRCPSFFSRIKVLASSFLCVRSPCLLFSTEKSFRPGSRSILLPRHNIFAYTLVHLMSHRDTTSLRQGYLWCLYRYEDSRIIGMYPELDRGISISVSLPHTHRRRKKHQMSEQVKIKQWKTGLGFFVKYLHKINQEQGEIFLILINKIIILESYKV